MKTYVGTSGYQYDFWRGNFYSEKCKKPDMLAEYAKQLSSVEINATFYRMPKSSVLARWATEVPDGFRFTLKASRRITHIKRLKEPDELLGCLVAVHEVTTQEVQAAALDGVEAEVRVVGMMGEATAQRLGRVVVAMLAEVESTEEHVRFSVAGVDHWLSLPYRTDLTTAQDVCDEIGPSATLVAYYDTDTVPSLEDLEEVGHSSERQKSETICA